MNEMQYHVVEVEGLIYPFLPNETGYQKRVFSAMNYSFQAGGKRLRPMMMLESFRSFGGTKTEAVAPFMAALEMIHTYSLIHDDLPAMDNDDYRRGKLTNHKMYDEATAILAGDGLLNLAFETVISATASQKDPEMMLRMAKASEILAKKAGTLGMIGGQMADIEAEKKSELSEEEILFIHENKTAALIQAALLCGALIAGADEQILSVLERVGYLCGVAFQIQDDILDLTGDSQILGKPTGSDEKNQKITYVTINGLEKSMEEQKAMSKEAGELLESLNIKEDYLKTIILGLIDREK